MDENRGLDWMRLEEGNGRDESIGLDEIRGR